MTTTNHQAQRATLQEVILSHGAVTAWYAEMRKYERLLDENPGHRHYRLMRLNAETQLLLHVEGETK